MEFTSNVRLAEERSCAGFDGALDDAPQSCYNGGGVWGWGCSVLTFTGKALNPGRELLQPLSVTG